MPVLIIPDPMELHWRRKLHSPLPFTLDWLTADPHTCMYRYISCSCCGDIPVGEIAWYMENERCMLHVLIHPDQRRQHFATNALRLLAEDARSCGFTHFFAVCPDEGTRLFLVHCGFRKIQDGLYKVELVALCRLPCSEEGCV